MENNFFMTAGHIVQGFGLLLVILVIRHARRMADAEVNEVRNEYALDRLRRG